LLEERFGNEIEDIFGISVASLTANEAQYLVGFRSLTKSEVVALRQKKKSIDADLRKAVTKCLASV